MDTATDPLLKPPPGLSRDFTVERLRVQVRSRAGAVHVDWLGEASARNPSESLTPALSALAAELRGRRVHLQFGELSFMNSATIPPIMGFVSELASVASHVWVHYDEALQWQATSFRAMRVVARKWQNVEVLGK